MLKQKLFILPGLLFLLNVQLVFAQLKVTQLTKKDIPANIKYTGHIINALRFIDADGEHLIITTETGKTPSKNKDFDGKDAALYAYHYKINGADFKLTWQTYDFEKDCPFDVNVNFLPNTFAVTDLNNDGKAEVWLTYKITCRSDVSPATMKIIMHDGDKKYAIRGENKVKVSATEYMGGAYKFDETFKAGPEVFRLYAAKLWKKNILENWK